MRFRRAPAIVIANEFLDALPIRQLVVPMRTPGTSGSSMWMPEGGLRFARRIAVWTSAAPSTPDDGAIVELRAGEDEVLARACRREPSRCVALFIDYGPAEPAIGDTLQAVRRHAYADPLVEPGHGRPDRACAVRRLGGQGPRGGPCGARPDHRRLNFSGGSALPSARSG